MKITGLSRLMLLCFLMGMVGTNGGLRAQQSRGERERIKIVIDTDIAEDIDDLLIVAFALNSPEFEVLAITTVDGDVEARSRVARRVAKTFGRPEVPVASGYVWNMPLADTPIPEGMYGVTQGELAPTEEGLPPASLLKADELVARLAEKHPGEIYLLALGSYANIGQLLVRYPESAAKLKAIVTSGVIMDPGPFTSGERIPDWNFRYDPLAGAVIMRSQIPWVITPSTAARYVGGITKEEVDRLIRTDSNPHHVSGIPWEDVDRIRAAGLPTTELLTEAIDLWKKNKPDAADHPHLADLSAFAYVLGGWMTTFRSNVYFTVPPAGVLPGIRLEVDPEGRALIANEIPPELGSKLYKLFLKRLLSPPLDQSD
ncbi:MAG: nucleoside hydrolase [Candidatus Glassbacteria bacterium]|nr:nucleoside hydrolase [Candidatus Glassbacteria bacterium]